MERGRHPTEPRRRGRSSQAIAVAFVAIAAAFLLYIVWLTVVDLERMKEEVKNEVAIASMALEEHAARTFGEAAQVLGGLAPLCTGADRPEPRLQQQAWINALVGTLPQLAFVALITPDGRPLFTSDSATGKSPAELRVAMERLGPETEGSPHRIGMPYHDPHNDRRIILLGRQLLDDAGEPCAVAIAGLDAERLEAFFRAFLGARDGVALLRREPRGILIRVPEPPEPVRYGPGFESPNRAGVEHVVSPIDGAVRIVGYRTVDGFPLGVRFAVSEREVNAQWRQRAVKSAIPAVGVLLLLFGAAFWIDRLLQRGRQREQRLARLNVDLDRAKHEAGEASEAKDRFLANMSHEVRTPLNAIVGIGDLLEKTPLDGRQGDYVRKLKVATGNLLALVNGVLDLSRAGSGRIELEQTEFDPAAMLREVVELADLVAGPKGLTMELTLDPALPPRLIGDPLRLRQILLNLVGNAVKFTEAGGVEVGAEVVDDDGERITLRLKVSDSGIGIPQAQLREVFALFTQADASTTRRYGGTGLGLTISQRIAHAMGSEITVQSRVGEGSTFSLDLTLQRADVTADTVTKTDHASLEGLHLLLVDDDPLGRTIERERLEGLGATISEAENGAEAVAACHAEPIRDAVLMDIQMPEMDGLEATQRMRSAGVRLPIIGLTANSASAERDRALKAGMDDCLGKPIDLGDIVAAIRRLQRSADTEGPA